jgi:hypothetical protein
MTTPGQIQIAGIVQQGQAPAATIGPYYIPIPAAQLNIVEASLSAGANVVTLPTATTFAMLVPPNYGFPTSISAFSGSIWAGTTSTSVTNQVSNVNPTLVALAGSSASAVSFFSSASTTVVVVSA